MKQQEVAAVYSPTTNLGDKLAAVLDLDRHLTLHEVDELGSFGLGREVQVEAVLQLLNAYE